FEMRLRLLAAITEQAEKIRSQSDDSMLMAPELAAAYLQIGIVQQQLGQLTNTAESLDHALSMYQMLTERHPDHFGIRLGLAESFSTRGYYWRNCYKYPAARSDYDRSQQLLRSIIHDY